MEKLRLQGDHNQSEYNDPNKGRKPDDALMRMVNNVLPHNSVPDMDDSALQPDNGSKPLVVWFILVIMTAIFILDIRSPYEYHIAYLYNICIGITLWSRSPRWVIAITLLSIIYYISDYGLNNSLNVLPSNTTIINATVDIFVLIAMGVLVWWQVIIQRRYRLNAQKICRREATLLNAERRAKEEAQHTEALARKHAAELSTALNEARHAMWQVQESMQREREARQRENLARQRELKISGDLERVKNLSYALHKAVLKSIPVSLAHDKIRLGALYLPAERDILIGGDFYDVIQLDTESNRIGLVIGDVAGHGVEAAAQTALVMTALRAYAFESTLGPAQILSRTSKLIESQLESFVSLFFGIYDSSTGCLVYANAGHEPPVVCRYEQSGTKIALEPTGAILGIGFFDFEERSIDIHTGDVVVLMTDGLTEVRTHTNDLLGWEEVARIAADRAMHLTNVQMIADGIVSDIRWISRDQRLTDDVALLVVKFQ